MKHVKLFEQFVNERLDVKGLSQKVMQELDTFGQLHPQYLPTEVLNTIEEVLGKYKSLSGGKLIQKIASEIRDELGETGNLANDSYRHIKDVDHIIAGALHESYSEEDINMSHGFFRTVLDAEDVKSEQDAIDLFDEGIMMLKKHYRLTEEEALAVLNSAMGRHAADQIVSGEANTAMLGLEQYYGKKLKSEIAKVQRTMVNENLRSDLKKYIKKNKKEIDQLADQDDWDGIYRMLMNDFEVEDGSEDAEDLKQTFNFVY